MSNCCCQSEKRRKLFQFLPTLIGWQLKVANPVRQMKLMGGESSLVLVHRSTTSFLFTRCKYTLHYTDLADRLEPKLVQRSNRSERRSTTSFTIGACISGGNNSLTFIWMPTEWGFWGSWLDKWYGDVKVQTNFYLLAWKHRSPCKWCTTKSNRRLYWSMVSRPPYLCFYLNWDLILLLLLLYFDTLRLSDSYQGQKSWCILSSIWCTNIFIGPVEPF